MTHASLFSGIGGFDLAAERAGWTNLFNCEIDPFCQQILKYHFPNATQYSDIKATDFTVWRGQIDVLTGGFPCQPFSTAGKRKGTDDDRYLWPEMLRAIREISPRWIVGENVRGIVNWSEGMVFEQVCSDLEAEGYEVTPFLLPACGVDAPHERYRTWFVAHRTDAGAQSLQQRQDGVCEFGVIADTDNPRGRTSENETIRNRATNSEQRQHSLDRTSRLSKIGSTPNADSHRSREWQNKQEPISGSCGATYNCSNGDNGIIADTSCKRNKKRVDRQSSVNCEPLRFDRFPTQSPVCRGDDGLSCQLDINAVFAGIPKSKRAKVFPRWRSESIKGFGNAIVPQVVLQIFNTINQINQQ